MEYLDDLDQEAMNAFSELNDDIAPVDQTSVPQLPPELENLLLLTKKSPTTPSPHQSLASAAILPSQPRIIQGKGEDGIAQFCQIRALDIPTIKEWLVKTYPTLCPVFAPINKARKVLLPDSAYPTLGYDTMLPHHRPDNTCEYLPKQDQYPAWYFFYGTLADASFLAELFGSRPEEHMLVPAVIYGGKLRTWGGKYNALVDDSPKSRVEGRTYEVVSQEQEDALCMYETAKYEVVRADIDLGRHNGGRCVVKGCMFCFAGQQFELD